ncbi:hypothetical protein G9A89_002332 [Geosiphon pyriformis]|nr:hypothetical protein G9A89_002332 [Geosiphon pyriformis]
MLLRGYLGSAPSKITDEVIDQALVMRNIRDAKKSFTNGSVNVASIDFVIRTPFTWYSPFKGVDKIGKHDIGSIVRLCTYIDDLISQKENSLNQLPNARRKRLSEEYKCPEL